MRYKYKLIVDRNYYENYQGNKDLNLFTEKVAACLRREAYQLPSSEEIFKEKLKQMAIKIEAVSSPEEYSTQACAILDWAENNGIMIKGLHYKL